MSLTNRMMIPTWNGTMGRRRCDDSCFCMCSFQARAGITCSKESRGLHWWQVDLVLGHSRLLHLVNFNVLCTLQKKYTSTISCMKHQPTSTCRTRIDWWRVMCTSQYLWGFCNFFGRLCQMAWWFKEWHFQGWSRVSTSCTVFKIASRWWIFWMQYLYYLCFLVHQFQNFIALAECDSFNVCLGEATLGLVPGKDDLTISEWSEFLAVTEAL